MPPAEYVGNSGSGTFLQSGGTNRVNGNLYLGYNSTSNGIYQLSGAGSLTAGSEYVGYSGAGTFTQSAGTNTISGQLYLGYNAAAGGTYQLSGAGGLSTANEYVGYMVREPLRNRAEPIPPITLESVPVESSRSPRAH